jgi:hypothetical protein
MQEIFFSESRQFISYSDWVVILLTSTGRNHDISLQYGRDKRFLGAFLKLRKATVSFVMSVRPHGTIQPPTGRIFLKCGILGFFENLSREFKFHEPFKP